MNMIQQTKYLVSLLAAKTIALEPSGVSPGVGDSFLQFNLLPDARTVQAAKRLYERSVHVS